MSWKKMAVIGISSLALALGASGGVRADNLVTNGGFETTTNGVGQLGINTTATGWSVPSGNTSSYAFVFNAASVNSPGSPGQYGNVALYSPASTSPAGGNFIGADSAFQQGAISQTITGLTAGDTYAVSFYWAAAQQVGFSGATTDQWQVSLGGETQSTNFISLPSQGFSGWVYQTFTYTATSAVEVLSFLANGTPVSPSEPPFALLDGVTMIATPEPSSMLVFGLGLLGLGAIRMRRRARTAAV